MNKGQEKMARTSNDFVRRIQSLVKKYGSGKYSRLANLTGVPASRWKRYLDGESYPSFEAIIAICTRLDVSPTWLLLGMHEQQSTRRSIPIFDLDLVESKLVEEKSGEELDLVGDFGKTVFAIRIPRENYHMSPTIQPGNLVVVDARRKPQQGSVVLAIHNGERFFARYWDTAGDMKLLIFDNPNCVPRELNEVRILGTATQIVNYLSD